MSKWQMDITPGLHPQFDEGVHITGYLGEEFGGKHRIYASLEDRSSYVEVDAGDIDLCIRHSTNRREVTVTIKRNAEIRVVRGDQRGPAQFLRGELSSQNMGGAIQAGHGPTLVTPLTCASPTAKPPTTQG